MFWDWEISVGKAQGHKLTPEFQITTAKGILVISLERNSSVREGRFVQSECSLWCWRVWNEHLEVTQEPFRFSDALCQWGLSLGLHEAGTGRGALVFRSLMQLCAEKETGCCDWQFSSCIQIKSDFCWMLARREVSAQNHSTNIQRARPCLSMS